MTRLIFAFGVAMLTVTSLILAQTREDTNVVYGLYSGLALLMNVYRPPQPNGIAIVAIRLGGFGPSDAADSSDLAGC